MKTLRDKSGVEALTEAAETSKTASENCKQDLNLGNYYILIFIIRFEPRYTFFVFFNFITAEG